MCITRYVHFECISCNLLVNRCTEYIVQCIRYMVMGHPSSFTPCQYDMSCSKYIITLSLTLMLNDNIDRQTLLQLLLLLLLLR